MNEINKDIPNIIDNKNLRYVEIYQIINIVTKKSYIGQAVSHILNHKRYRRYGSKGRFKCHISEAFSKKKNQCHYLNNSIRKHGKDNFILNIIDKCKITEADEKEYYYIKKYNTLFPNGYNLKLGGKVFRHCNESKKRVSNGVKKFFIDKKLERFKNIKIPEGNIENFIKPLNKYKKQYGWYVYINKTKADFGGVHTSLEQSKKDAINFINRLKKLNTNSKTP